MNVKLILELLILERIIDNIEFYLLFLQFVHLNMQIIMHMYVYKQKFSSLPRMHQY